MPLLSRFVLLLSFLGAISPSLMAQSRGDLVQKTLLESWSQNQIRSAYTQLGLAEFLSPIEYDIDIFKITYYTRAVREDTLIIASGLLVIPKGDCDFPLVGYGHGTTFYNAIPSDRSSQEWLLGVPFAANGYIMALPDYLGYGETPKEHPHPYVHARSEAWAMVDMLRASRQVAEMDSIRLNDQVFLIGYSQGGHAAMAAHREIETYHANEFDLTVVAPCSGPYDVSGVQFQDITSEKPTSAFYLAFVMTSYQYVYGNLWQDPSDAFVAPWDSLIPRYFDRQNPQPVPLPDTAIRMLQPSYIQAVLADSMHPAMQALRDNDLTNWTPQAPTRMYYC
ncbi:MAG: lipase family protein, partial [Bacteroidota bacterium]